ncbi:MAG: hypothetical protein GXN93_03285 [Candidatus Diapherotrites archaeon]|nr:hypothetical protein [Candidatus Diapherotrites archaeon]
MVQMRRTHFGRRNRGSRYERYIIEELRANWPRVYSLLERGDRLHTVKPLSHRGAHISAIGGKIIISCRKARPKGVVTYVLRIRPHGPNEALIQTAQGMRRVRSSDIPEYALKEMYGEVQDAVMEANRRSSPWDAVIPIER